MSKKINKELIRCPSCTKKFPVNYTKHPNRKTVQCPFCRTELKQLIIDKTWKPNESWLKRRLSHISKPFTLETMRRILNGNGKIDLKDEVGRPKETKIGTVFTNKEARLDTPFLPSTQVLEEKK
jgi:hypothetical protein